MTDRNEALRLADALDAEVVRTVQLDVTHSQAAALLRQQAERIAELEVARAIDTFGHNVMAGRAQLQMVRLESRLQSLTAERDQLRAEVERLMVDAERLDHIEKHARCDPKMDGQHVWWPTKFNDALRGPTLRAAIDAARTSHKETE